MELSIEQTVNIDENTEHKIKGIINLDKIKGSEILYIREKIEEEWYFIEVGKIEKLPENYGCWRKRWTKDFNEIKRLVEAGEKAIEDDSFEDLNAVLMSLEDMVRDNA